MTKGIQLARRRPRTVLVLALGMAMVAAAGVLYLAFFSRGSSGSRLLRLRQYWANPAAHATWAIDGGQRCPAAPFLLPTDGYIGFRWGDAFRAGHRHQGLDIFGPTGPDGLGETPVVAAYDGYLTRLPDWRSSVILRHPLDPLHAGRQIWTYYTHMADESGASFILDGFPPGTSDMPVRAGDLLGYQGNYSGDAGNPTGMHLHFSVVLDDGNGQFLNELRIENTVDPAPYLGLEERPVGTNDSVLVCRNS